jgi:hypothetical protein
VCVLATAALGAALALLRSSTFPFETAKRALESLVTAPTSDERFRAELNDRARFARNNMRQLLIAMRNYHACFRVLPYHPDGPDHALFLLGGLVDEPCLAATPVQGSGREPRWDLRHGRVINCGWEYLNEKQGAAWDPSQIVLISKRIPGWKTVFMGFKNELILMQDFDEYPGRSVLGAYYMSDGSIRKKGVGSWTWSASAEAYKFQPETAAQHHEHTSANELRRVRPE